MTRHANKIIYAGLAIGLVSLAAMAQTATPLGGMPLYFEANRGQADPSVRFLARGRDSQFLISPAEAQIVLRKEAAEPATVRMLFVDANPQARIRGDAELPGKINYLVGNDPAQWHTGVPTFAKVRVEGIYPGIGLVYYGNQQQLEYDFQVAPGANPDAIRIHFDGVDKTAVNAQGELVLTLNGGEIRQPKPVIYQMANGARREISGGYRLVDAHTIAFTVGNYNHSLLLVIDPILSYSTYFGGNYGETAWAVAINTNDGSIYIAGQTFSTQFTNWPVPPGAYQTNFQGGSSLGDGFVARLDNLGTNLIYLTYIGGNVDDVINSLAVDGAGNAYITGYTDSTNFPVTNSIPGFNGVPNLPTNIVGQLNPKLHVYPVDAFVTELNTNGSKLVYSTYLGGSAADGGYGIAVDSAGNAYVTGFTASTNFPCTTNAMLKHLACTNTFFFNVNAFVTEISANGTNLVYSSYLGGTNYDWGRGIAVDSSNFVYVTGFTASTNFPTTNAVKQQLVYVTYTTNSAPTNQVFTTNFVNGYLLNGATNQTSTYDAFITKFMPSCTGLVYSTFLGGTNNDEASSIAVDNNGNAYVTGWTVSTNFPNTVTNSNLHNGLTNNLYYGYSITTNAFLTEITWNGTNAGIGYSTVFGGTNACIDVGNGVAVDPAGDAFVVGTTSSTNFPCYPTNNFIFLRTTNSGGNDVFVIAFKTNATDLLYSTYLGGNNNDFGCGIAVDMNDNAYVVGQTLSTNFPTLNARQTTRNGTNDAFLAKITLSVLAPVITVQPTNQTAGVGSTVTFSVTVTGTPPFLYQWQEGGTNLTDGTTINGSTISGSTNATLTIFNAQTNDSGIYSVSVTNYAGSTISSNAVLTVTNVLPVITTQPVSQTVGVGSKVSFSVFGTDGTLPEFLQWLKDGIDLTNGTNVSGSIISGTTINVLTISNVQTNDEGTYWLVVTNPAGVVTSSNAVLTVLPAPLFGSIMAAGGTNGGFILSGVGGSNNATYYVLTSSNLLVPLGSWTPIATNQFDSLGGFIFTNAAQTNAPQLFYILKQP